MLLMTVDVQTAMIAHALRERPNEACGMFSSIIDSSLVDVFHPVDNAAESPTVFALDPQQMLDVERGCDQTGRTIVGVMHSHTETSPYPSPTDLEDSARYDPTGVFRHVIVSLRHAEPELRCFSLAGGEVTEVPIVLSDGDDLTFDEGGTIAAVVALPPPE